MPDQNDKSLPTGAVPPPLVERQPVEHEKIEPCPKCRKPVVVYLNDMDERFVVCISRDSNCLGCWSGPCMPTKAEAIAEWNRVARAVREAPAREKLIAELTLDIEAAKGCLHNAAAELNRGRQQAGPVAQALEAYRRARAKWMSESGITAQTTMVNAQIALCGALDAEATPTTPDSDASASRGAPAGEKREVVDQARGLHTVAGNNVCGNGFILRRVTLAEAHGQIGAQLRTAIVQIKRLERCNVRELGRLEACWLAANDRWKAERDRAEKAEATLAERDKRIATLEAVMRAVVTEWDARAPGAMWPPFEALRAALEGKEAPRG